MNFADHRSAASRSSTSAAARSNAVGERAAEEVENDGFDTCIAMQRLCER